MSSPSHIKEEQISIEELESLLDTDLSNEFPTSSVDETARDDWPSSSTNQITNHHAPNGENQTEDLADLLKSWDQLDLLNYFRDQDIDVNVLKNVECHHLDQLLRPFTYRKLILFESSLREWREKIGKPLFIYSRLGPMRRSVSTSRESNTKATVPYPSASPKPASLVLTTPSHGVTLATILNNTSIGKILEKSYDMKNRLQETQRTALINIVAQYFEQNELHLDLSTSHRMEQEIIKRFPTEKLEYYRTSKRGKIYNKFSNLKSAMKFLDSSLAYRKSSADESRQEEQSSDTEKSDGMVPEEDADEAVRLLKCENLSKEQFDRWWRACTNLRLLDIKNSESMCSLLSKWPQYKLRFFYRLIDMDFSCLFKGSRHLLDDWEDLQGKLLEFLSTENHVKERTIKMVICKLKSSSPSKHLSNICRDAAILWSLHGYIVPTQKVVQKNKEGKLKVIRSTIKDSQDSFVWVCNTVQDMEDRIVFLNSNSDLALPYIILLGEDILNFSEIYLYFGGEKHSFISFIRAVDICFKIFKVFNINYPQASQSFWGFIESQYIKCEKTKLCPKTHILLNDLKK